MEYLANLDWSVVWEFRFPLLRGLRVTLFLMVTASILGMIGGSVLAIAGRSRFRVVRWLVVGYIELWRDTPLLVQLIWIHFALPVLTGFSTTALVSGVIGLTLNTSAYCAEIVRAGIDSIGREQWEAARSLGLRVPAIWWTVILPQVVKVIVAPMTNTLVSVFKGTAIVSILAVNDLMRVATSISNATFKPVELITAAAIVYCLLGAALSWLSGRVERRFPKSMYA